MAMWSLPGHAALAAFALAGLLLGQPARADAPDPSPVLRVETATHAAHLSDLALSPDGGLVATVSADKTLRIWDSRTAEPVAVLRPPVAPGSEGVLNAVRFYAAGPERRLVIAGGLTGQTWDGTIYAHLFDVDSGEIIHQHSLPGALTHVATLEAEGRTAGIALAWSNREAGQFGVELTNGVFGNARHFPLDAPVAALDIAADGRLAIVTERGRIVILQPGAFAAADVPVAADVRLADATLGPRALRLSPDGRFLAIGYEARPFVDLLSARDFAPIARFDVTGPSGVAEVAALAFAPGDGGVLALLAAGGLVDAAGRHVVRRWPDITRPDRFADIAVAEDAVSALLAGPDGRVFFAAADPVWGTLAEPSRPAAPPLRSAHAGLDTRDIDRKGFVVSPDGARVALRPGAGTDVPWLLFDAARLQLETGLAGPPAGGLVQTPPARLSAWRNAAAPTFGGRRLRLLEGERARSAHALADGRFLLGTDYNLYLFDRNGREIARRPIDTAAQAIVAVEGDRRLVVAYRDGTIRWHTLEKGRLLDETGSLLVVRPDRWAAWLSDGRFAASANGGSEIVGFHINRASTEAARWVGLGQLFEAMYAPDAIRWELGRDPSARLRLEQRLAAAIRPEAPPPPATAVAVLAAAEVPEVAVTALCHAPPGKAETCIDAALLTRGASRTAPAGTLALPAGIDRVTVRFRVRMAAEPEAVNVLVNGRTASLVTRGASRTPPAADDGWRAFQRDVALQPGSNEIEVRVQAPAGLYGRSRPVSIEVPPPPAAPERKPVLHALVIAAEAYYGELPQLVAAADDADAFEALLSRHPAGRYGSVSIISLRDAAVTRAGILAAFDALAGKVAREDSVVIYLAGHGDLVGTRYHFVPVEVDRIDRIAEGGLSQDDILAASSRIAARELFLIIDTCHSGAFPSELGGKLHDASGYYVLAASTDVELAIDAIPVPLEGSIARHGALMLSILEGSLLGRAATRESTVVSAYNLGAYAERRVTELAGEKLHRQQAEFFVRGRGSYDLLSVPQ